VSVTTRGLNFLTSLRVQMWPPRRRRLFSVPMLCLRHVSECLLDVLLCFGPSGPAVSMLLFSHAEAHLCCAQATVAMQKRSRSWST
jgi:hypothetical protein